jgi:hypothetical protein
MLKHFHSEVDDFRQGADDNLGRARDSQSQIVDEEFGNQYPCPPGLKQHNEVIDNDFHFSGCKT